MQEVVGKSQHVKVWEAIGRLSGGGAETQVLMLAGGLAAQSYEVSIVYVLKRANDPELPSRVQSLFIPRKSRLSWLDVFKEVRRLMDLDKPDLVHVWLPEVISIPVALVAYARGIPVISSIRRSTFKGVRGINWLRDFMGLLPHCVSKRVVSNFSLTHEPKVVRLLTRKKGVVIPNGLDLRRYGLADKNADSSGGLSLVFVGRFALQKRLLFLLRVLAKMPQGAVTLTVFGEGDEASTKEVEDVVKKNQLEEFVSFEGFVRKWRSHSHRFDMLITPSVSEGMPNVVIEAMAEGLPVIASDIPEMRAILTDSEDGFLFPPDDEAALIQVIQKCCNMPLESMSDRAKATAQRYSAEAMVSKYDQIYREVLNGK